MKCSHCNEKIALPHKPGIFLAVTIVFLITFLVGWNQSSLILMIASGFITLMCLGGIFSEMSDASAHVYSEHQHLGVYCKSCNKINSIKPWSI